MGGNKHEVGGVCLICSKMRMMGDRGSSNGKIGRFSICTLVNGGDVFFVAAASRAVIQLDTTYFWVRWASWNGVATIMGGRPIEKGSGRRGRQTANHPRHQAA